MKTLLLFLFISLTNCRGDDTSINNNSSSQEKDQF